MKVSFITEAISSPGGIARVLTVVANKLSEQHDVTICVFEQKNKATFYKLKDNVNIQYWEHIERRHFFKAIVRRINKKTGVLKKIGSENLFDYFFFSERQEKYWIQKINENFYDVVIGLTGKSSIMLGRIADRINCKVMGWQHSCFRAYIKSKGEYFFGQDYLFKKYIGRLDRNIVLNEKDANLYLKELGIKSQVIYNPRSFQSNVKSELSEKRFVAVGALGKAKGYEFLMESSKVFTKIMPEWKIFIYGDGPLKNKLKKMIKKESLSQNVFLAGNSSEIKKEMLNSSGLLLPSRWEGMPMVVLEALEMGVPVISYDISAMYPLISNGKEGIVVSRYDTDEFANAMVTLARNRKLRIEMGKNACLKSEKFDLDNIIFQWNKILAEVINE